MFQFSSEILEICKGQSWCPGLNLHTKEWYEMFTTKTTLMHFQTVNA